MVTTRLSFIDGFGLIYPAKSAVKTLLFAGYYDIMECVTPLLSTLLGPMHCFVQMCCAMGAVTPLTFYHVVPTSLNVSYDSCRDNLCPIGCFKLICWGTGTVYTLPQAIPTKFKILIM